MSDVFAAQNLKLLLACATKVECIVLYLHDSACTSIAHAYMYMYMTVLERNGGGALPFHPWPFSAISWLVRAAFSPIPAYQRHFPIPIRNDTPAIRLLATCTGM